MKKLPFLLIPLVSLPLLARENIQDSRVRNQWILWGALVGGTAVVGTQDGRIQRRVPVFLDTRFARKLDLKDFGRQGTAFEVLGTPLSVLAVGGSFYLAGLLKDSESAKDAGFSVAEAFVVNSVLVLSIKEVVGRARPVSTSDSHRFKPFSANASFPSGHTSTAFSVATIVSDYYESPWASALSYGLAGLVGVGRVLQNKHWTSDVLVGAMLGYGSGSLVLRWKKKHDALSFGIYPTGQGIFLSRKF